MLNIATNKQFLSKQSKVKNMKILLNALLLGVLILSSCQEKKADVASNENNGSKNDIASSLMISLQNFSCSFNDEDIIQIKGAKAKVEMTDNAPKSLEIEGIYQDKLLTIFVNLFDGKGDYPFENNEAGVGIGMSEVIVQENGIEKTFTSTSGRVTISQFDELKRVLSGTFEAAYFHQGAAAPEFLSISSGKFGTISIEQ